MYVEILGPDNVVHYRRPHEHPDCLEGLNTVGYWLRLPSIHERRAVRLMPYVVPGVHDVTDSPEGLVIRKRTIDVFVDIAAFI